MEKGADAACCDNEPLLTAVSNGNKRIAKMLIKKGADVTARDNEALIIAVENGDLRMAKMLVAEGADVKARDNYALKIASENENINMAMILIKNGAEYNVFFTIGVRSIIDGEITMEKFKEELKEVKNEMKFREHFSKN